MNRPTKEQYLKNIEDIQKRNLNSNTFKKVYQVATEYLSRKYKKEEYQFFKLFRRFEYELDNVKYYNGNFSRLYKYYLEMSSFINDLPEEIIDGNCLLGRIKILINGCYINALNFVNEFVSQVSNYAGSFKYGVELPLSQELSDCLLDWLTISEMVMTPAGDDIIFRHINVLSDDYIEYYKKYNELSKTMRLVFGKILNYQMIMILSTFPYNAKVQLPRLGSVIDGKRNIIVDFGYCKKEQKDYIRELKDKN